MSEAGYTVVLIGHAGHEEVERRLPTFGDGDRLRRHAGAHPEAGLDLERALGGRGRLRLAGGDDANPEGVAAGRPRCLWRRAEGLMPSARASARSFTTAW